MLKLTNLEGKEFYVRQNAIVLVREAFEDEYEGKVGAVISVGGKYLAVHETVPQIMGKLGTPIG